MTDNSGKKGASDRSRPELEVWSIDDEDTFSEDKGDVLGPVVSVRSGEEAVLTNLRPTAFADYIGQEHIKMNLQIACGAARQRGEALDHVLLHGPPGLGKTSLARIIAVEMGVSFKGTSGPVIERPGDLAAILTSLADREVLFIDEIHRLPRAVEEVLYPALEDFELDIMIGQGPSAKSIRVPLKPFTLVGATTRSGMLTSPLRDRFGLVHRLDFYGVPDLKSIVLRSAKILEVPIEDSAAGEIAARSRGTPRIANRLLRRARDYADQQSDGSITIEVARAALELLEIDRAGMDRTDRAILEVIIEKFSGGPVGVDTIAASLGEERETLEDVYEPFLMQSGYLARTRRGREVTELGYAHLGRVPQRVPVEARQGSLQLGEKGD